MAVSTIDTTIGSASANAYCTVAFADQFHEDRASAGTTWTEATADEKAAAILWATVLMDSLIVWTGWVVDDIQALMWPRHGMTKRNGYEVLSTVIPIEVQRACAEYARQLLDEDRAADSDVETQGIKSLKAGPVTLQFKDTVSAKVVPDAIVNLLVDSWWETIKGREQGMIPVVRS